MIDPQAHSVSSFNMLIVGAMLRIKAEVTT